MGNAAGVPRDFEALEKRYSLSDSSEAIRYLEEGHARGKVA
jgi:hypothetical protein